MMEGRGRLFIVDLSLFMAESCWGLKCVRNVLINIGAMFIIIVLKFDSLYNILLWK